MNRRTTYRKPLEQIEGERAARGIIFGLVAVLALYAAVGLVAVVVLFIGAHS